MISKKLVLTVKKGINERLAYVVHYQFKKHNNQPNKMKHKSETQRQTHLLPIRISNNFQIVPSYLLCDYQKQIPQLIGVISRVF